MVWDGVLLCMGPPTSTELYNNVVKWKNEVDAIQLDDW